MPATRRPDYRRFLERLRAARRARGLTQVQVARALGRPQSFVSKSETGERRLDVVELAAFARLYRKGVRPKVPCTTPDPLTDDEAARVLTRDSKGEYVIGEQHALVVRLILATGLRWSDIIRLKASDLKPDGWLVLTCSKTGKLLRIPLGGTDPELAREIRRRVGRLVPFSRNTLGTFNRAVQRRSGVERFTTYRAKDRFGCQWMNNGGSRDDLQEVFGHADPRTTMRYARASDARIMGEAKRIAEAQR